ncbi:MAG: enoyl-CoA hydratase [Pseudomonadales bacterium]
MSDHLLETIDRGVATLTMNRPEARNALSPSMMAGLEEAIPRLASDPEVRVVVLTGAGRAFCAGGDVKGFAEAPASSSRRPSFDDRVKGLRSSTELVRHLHEMPKPTLAVIPGPAAGGGLSFALACDIRIAVETAKFTTAFSKIAVSGDYGGSYFLTQLVGTAKARELYFSADVIFAPEALRLGMVNQVYAEEAFNEQAREYAERLAALPPMAIAYMKKNLNKALHGTLGDVLDLEADHMTRTFDTDDHRNAARAFVEKRSPEFNGR